MIADRYALDDLLRQWHTWAQGYRLQADIGPSAMFRTTKSPRGWQDEGEIADETIHHDTMQAVDFAVGQLEDIHRTAIQIEARNLTTGRSVWTSSRLPTDLQERAIVVLNARNALHIRLIRAGVLTSA